MDWKEDLGSLFSQREAQRENQRERSCLEYQEYLKMKEEVINFFLSKVIPAFEELKSELEKYNRNITVSQELGIDIPQNSVTLNIEYDTSEAYCSERFIYTVVSPDEVTVWIDIKYLEGNIIREDIPKSSIRSYDEDDIYSVSKEDIINHFIFHYKKHI